MTGEYYLPSKISTYLKRLKIEYERPVMRCLRRS